MIRNKLKSKIVENRKIAYYFFGFSLLMILIVSYFLLGAKTFKANLKINDYYISTIKSKSEGFLNFGKNGNYIYITENKRGFGKFAHFTVLDSLIQSDSQIIHFFENKSINSINNLEEKYIRNKLLERELEEVVIQLENEEKWLKSKITLKNNFRYLLDSITRINKTFYVIDSILYENKDIHKIEFLSSKKNYLMGREKLYFLEEEVTTEIENFNLKKERTIRELSLQKLRNQLEIDILIKNLIVEYEIWKAFNLIELIEGDRLLFESNSKVNANEPLLVRIEEVEFYEGYIEIPENDYLKFKNNIKNISLKFTNDSYIKSVNVKKISFVKIPNTDVYKAIVNISKEKLMGVNILEVSIELHIIYLNLDFNQLF